MAGTSPDLAARGPDCLSEDALRGILDGGERQADEDHLGTCEACQTRLQNLAGGEMGVSLKSPPREEHSEALRQAIATLKTAPLNATVSLEECLDLASEEGLLGRLGPYEVHHVIAEGGMGIVLEARDPLLDREVAIKLIKPQQAGGESVRQRMLSEARAVAAIEHESVVPIHAAEVSEKTGTVFIVMPLVSGGNLQDRLDDASGPLPVGEICSIGSQVAAGLAAAHAQGILHRDIKPANVLMRGNGKVWLADFGIASSRGDTGLTRVGEVQGTLQFMSPEQVDEKDCDARSDLFSLGAVLYQLATGESAFARETTIQTVRAIADHPHRSLTSYNPDLPPWLTGLIDDLLAKDPEKRPRDANEVVTRLTSGTEFEEKNHNSRRRLITMAIGLALLVPAWFILRSVDRDPTVPSDAASPLPTWAMSKFSNARAEQGYATLPEAITAAAPGDTIEIRVNGTAHDESLPTIDKALVLRAAVGFEPSLISSNRKKSLLHNTAPLVLEGLRVRQISGPSISPPVILAGASLSATNCSIGRDSRALRGGIDVRPGILTINGAERVDLLNCVFISNASHALLVETGPCEVQLENVFIATPTGVFFRHAESENVGIHIKRSSYHGKGFAGWERHDDGHLAPVAFNLERSAVEPTLCMFGAPESDLDTVKSAIRFRGSDNLYASGTRFLRHASPDGRKEISSLKEWQELWSLGDEGSLICPMDLQQRLMGARRGAELDHHALRPSTEASKLYPERGFDPETGGLGEIFGEFRQTPAYRAWFVRVTTGWPAAAGKK